MLMLMSFATTQGLVSIRVDAAMRKYETYTFSASKFFADRGAEGVAQPLTERINVSTVQDPKR
jgi:hypothetical protein